MSKKYPTILLKHMPQARASTRIVLGTLDELKQVINIKRTLKEVGK